MKYLSVDGERAHIGMLGDGVFDINPDGVNVITYQTALAAFNEKFSESKNKIEVDELAGEGARKTLEQLESEFSVAEKAFLKAKEQASQQLANISLQIEVVEEKISSADEKEKKILEKNLDKVDWKYLSENPIHILEQNLDKVSWDFLSQKYEENSNLRAYYFNEIRKVDTHIEEFVRDVIIIECNLNRGTSKDIVIKDVYDEFVKLSKEVKFDRIKLLRKWYTYSVLYNEIIEPKVLVQSGADYFNLRKILAKEFKVSRVLQLQI